MIHFVGAGSGAADLITVRGARLLSEADVIIYAGSLVNPQLLRYAREDCKIYDSAVMTLEEVLEVMEQAEKRGETTVRLHTGDPSIYGAVKEQYEELEKRKITYDVCPGVSSFCGAAAALKAEYTIPEISQTVIISRAAGRTPVPEQEAVEKLAAHQATMILFLSAGQIVPVQNSLIQGGYEENTPVALVYKATWPQERICHTTVGEMAKAAAGQKITKTALIIVGRVLGEKVVRSRLYSPDFATEYRGVKQ